MPSYPALHREDATSWNVADQGVSCARQLLQHRTFYLPVFFCAGLFWVPQLTEFIKFHRVQTNPIQDFSSWAVKLNLSYRLGRTLAQVLVYLPLASGGLHTEEA